MANPNLEIASCTIAVGFSPLPYFVAGLASTLVLLLIGYRIYRDDNTVIRGGMKSIDMILPIYVVPCGYTMVIGILFGVANIFGLLQLDLMCSIAKWFFFRFVNDGLAVFLMHNGIGQRAYDNAIVLGFVWSGGSAVVSILIYKLNGYGPYFYLAATGLGILLSIYIFLAFLPQKWLHRRPAMVNYALWNVAIISTFLSTLVILHYPQFRDSACYVEMIYALGWFIQPFVILFTMRQDSLFWQGLYSDSSLIDCGDEGCLTSLSGTRRTNRAFQQESRNLNEVLLGVWDFGRDTMDTLAESITTLEKKVVPIIPFGMISIDTTRFFSGGTARVYRGKYRKETVAVKLLFCLELTPERVKEFCSEATLLNSVQHENVVKCWGVSVMPPAICLITEYCDNGSLYDLMHSSDFVIDDQRRHSQAMSLPPYSSAAGVGGRGVASDEGTVLAGLDRAARESQRSSTGTTSTATGGAGMDRISGYTFNGGNSVLADSITTTSHSYNNSLLHSTRSSGVLEEGGHSFLAGTTGVEAGSGVGASFDSIAAIDRALLTLTGGAGSSSATGSGASASGRASPKSMNISSPAQGEGDGTVDDSGSGNSSGNADMIPVATNAGNCDNSSSIGGGGGDDLDGEDEAQTLSWQSNSDLCLSLMDALDSRPGSTRSSFTSVNMNPTGGYSGPHGGYLPPGGNPLHSGAAHLLTSAALDLHTVAAAAASTNAGVAEKGEERGEQVDVRGAGESGAGAGRTHSEESGSRATYYSADLHTASAPAPAPAPAITTATGGGSVEEEGKAQAPSSMQQMGLKVQIVRRGSGSRVGGGVVGRKGKGGEADKVDNHHDDCDNDYEDAQEEEGEGHVEHLSSADTGVTSSHFHSVHSARSSRGSRSRPSSSSQPHHHHHHGRGRGEGGRPSTTTTATTSYSREGSSASIGTGSWLVGQGRHKGSKSKSIGNGGTRGQAAGAAPGMQKLATIMRHAAADEDSNRATEPASHSGPGAGSSGASREGTGAGTGAGSGVDSSWHVLSRMFSITSYFSAEGGSFGRGGGVGGLSGAGVQATKFNEEALVRAAYLKDGGGTGGAAAGRAEALDQLEAGTSTGAGAGAGAGAGSGGERTQRLFSNKQSAIIGDFLMRVDSEGTHSNATSIGIGTCIDGSTITQVRDEADSFSRGGGWGDGGRASVSVREVLPLSLRLRLARDCAAGVAHLHSSGIMHNDIKSLNFLVDKDLHVKLADLGESQRIPRWDPKNPMQGVNNNSPRRDTLPAGSGTETEAEAEVGEVGASGGGAGAQANETPSLSSSNLLLPKALPQNVNWSAPEVLLGEQDVDASSDIWSLTLVISEILAGEVPFDSLEYRKLSLGEFIAALKRGARPELPAAVTAQCPWITDLMARGWAFRAEDRCTGVEMVAELESRLGMKSGTGV